MGPDAHEAQQRYFGYCAILAAIVAQNSFMLVCMGYRTIITRPLRSDANEVGRTYPDFTFSALSGWVLEPSFGKGMRRSRNQ